MRVYFTLVFWFGEFINEAKTKCDIFMRGKKLQQWTRMTEFLRLKRSLVKNGQFSVFYLYTSLPKIVIFVHMLNHWIRCMYMYFPKLNLTWLKGLHPQTSPIACSFIYYIKWFSFGFSFLTQSLKCFWCGNNNQAL